MNGNLSRAIVRAAWCPHCLTRLGQKCTDRLGKPVAPHPARQKLASDRFPKIAEAIAAQPPPPPPPPVVPYRKLSKRQVARAAELLGTAPLAAIARKYGVTPPTMRRSLIEAGHRAPQPAGRSARGQFLKGRSGNPGGAPRSASTTAILVNPCPSCGAAAEASCRTISGRSHEPHVARAQAIRDNIATAEAVKAPFAALHERCGALQATLAQHVAAGLDGSAPPAQDAEELR